MTVVTKINPAVHFLSDAIKYFSAATLKIFHIPDPNIMADQFDLSITNTFNTWIKVYSLLNLTQTYPADDIAIFIDGYDTIVVQSQQHILEQFYNFR